MDIMLSIGNIIIDEQTNKKYRVVAIVNNEITLCEMETSKFCLVLMSAQIVLSLIGNNDLRVKNEEKQVLDKEKLPLEEKTRFETN